MKKLFFILLLFLSIVGNYFSVPLFFGVDIIFGSIFVYCLLFYFGLIPALIAALISGLYTIYLWGHPYAFVIFFLEILIAGSLYKKYNKNIIIINVLYWILIAAPFVFLFYGTLLGLNIQTRTLITLKMFVNGVFNVVIAYLIFVWKPFRNQKGISLQKILFAVFVMMVLAVSLAIMVIAANKKFSEIQKNIVHELKIDAGVVKVFFDNWINSKTENLEKFKFSIADMKLEHSKELQQVLKYNTLANKDFHNMYIADKNAMTIGFYPAVNENGKSTIGLNFSDRNYYKKLKKYKNAVLSDEFKGRGGIFKPIVTLSIPIIENEKFNGYILAAVDIASVQNQLLKILNNTGMSITFIDSSGKVVITNTLKYKTLDKYSLEKNNILSKQDDNIYYKTSNNIKTSKINKWKGSSYIFKEKIGFNSNWIMIMEMPIVPFQSDLYNFYINILTTDLIIVLIAMFIYYFLTKRLTGSLNELTGLTHQFTKKIYSKEQPRWPKTSIEEINSLINNFSEMSDELKNNYDKLIESNEKLESIVEERTHNLEKANRELTTEIESRKNIQKILELHDKAIESAVESIIITDATASDNPIIFVNKAYEKLTGYSFDEVKGKNPKILQGQFTEKSTKKQIRKALNNKENSQTEILTYKKNGKTFWNLLSISPIINETGELTHWVGSQLDISHIKENEKELMKAKELAEESNKAKSQFLATMSHEIRTPMNAIINMANFLSETEIDKKQKEYIDLLLYSSNSLLAIINDILDLSKIESGDFELEKIPFDLRKIVNKALQIIKLRSDQTGLAIIKNIDDELPDRLIGDPNRLNQILLNLLSNAEKFTDNGYIKVSVDVEKSFNNNIELLFQIADTGVGIPNNKKVKIFQRFTQVDSSTTRKYGGSGLGLTICKHLIEKMGGKIWIEDNEKRGSIFKFKIMLNLMSAGYKETADFIEDVEKKRIIKPINILIVEDSLSNQFVIKNIFSKDNFKCTIADNGKIGLEKYKQSEFDLILMDISMPIMDGYESAAKIREYESNENKKKTPILALTAHALREEKNKIDEHGAFNGYASKPVNKVKLFKEIYKVLPEFFNDVIEEKKIDNDLVQAVKTDVYPGLDIDRALGIFDGETELYRQIVDIYLGNNKEVYDNLIKYYKSQNIEEVKFYAHKLKSSSANAGAFTLSEILGQIEEIASNNNLPEKILIDKMIDKFEISWNSLNKYMNIDAVADGETNKSCPEIDDDENIRIINDLKKQLNKNDMQAIETAKELKESLIYYDEIKNLISDLIEEIKMLNYDKADNVLESIENIINKKER